MCPNVVDRLKPSDYDMSLRKYWRENVTSGSESNVGDITTMLYIPTIDRLRPRRRRHSHLARHRVPLQAHIRACRAFTNVIF